ncbi:hypothetical protein [Microbacterium hibisci]|uniref:hypothetical protein n=1 Tax=Microbacterium hibisci TaxID=2036000 RepID=UPI001943BD9C|nr:hypothetical protein [Microbacterium hibisci]
MTAPQIPPTAAESTTAGSGTPAAAPGSGAATAAAAAPAPAFAASVPGRRLTALGGLALIAGAVLYTAGIATSPPQASEAASDYIASLAADPGLTQLSAALLHFGNLFLALGFLAVPGLVRGSRGGWLTLVGALLATLSHALVSGWVLFDFWTMTIGRELDATTALALFEAVQSGSVFGILSMLPMLNLLAMPLATAGLARAGVVPWWLLAFAVVPTVVMFVVPFSPALFAAVTAVGFIPAVWFGLAVLRRVRAERALAV